MNNDYELLRLAAKAGGIEFIDGRNVTGLGPMNNIMAAPFWNPLCDDGDAFRLSVALNMDVCSDKFNHEICGGWE